MKPNSLLQYLKKVLENLGTKYVINFAYVLTAEFEAIFSVKNLKVSLF
ncbi:MAG: hypothetical protein F6K18_06560 [Okeania sp. SIO2C2]|nr:hypothetical protein [Okeania sp. SIO2C2]NEP86516.1 hypothetical protein [Okeania sp. SIO2C2]